MPLKQHDLTYILDLNPCMLFFSFPIFIDFVVLNNNFLLDFLGTVKRGSLKTHCFRELAAPGAWQDWRLASQCVQLMAHNNEQMRGND